MAREDFLHNKTQNIRNALLRIVFPACLLGIDVAMRYSPKLPDGDYFQFVSAVKGTDVRYFVAALALQPSVYVFSGNLG